MASTLQYAELLLKGLNCKLAMIKKKLDFHPIPYLFYFKFLNVYCTTFE